MFVNDVLSSGAMPTLSAMMRYAGQRQTLLAHNIANLSTPNFQQMDVSPDHFQKVLSKAVDERRSRTGGMFGELKLAGDRQIEIGKGGAMRLNPARPSGNILFHDRNNRDLEQLMQDLTENVGAFRLATDLMRQQNNQIKDALSERA